ncbi:MAG: hypothetical protein M1365_17190, partial [Actinobacteria bacterium]|nr:hypothetical protein [Actinomycetota bacterium]
SSSIFKKYCKQSADGKTMYDSWGVGYDITQEGICIKYNPVPDDFNLENYKFPDPNGSHLLDRAKMIKEKYKDKYCIVPLLGFGIFERAYTLRGFGNFLIDMKTNKKFAEELLDKITEYQLSLAKRFIDMGIDCVMDSNDFGTQENLIMSVDDWKKFIMPRLKKIWDLFKKEKIPVILHSCGNIIKIIPYLIEIGLDVLNPIQHVMDPELLKKQFGKDIVFFGGIDSQNLLTNGNPEEIKREVKRYIQILGKDGGYIIAPDQCLMSNVPVINILTLVKAIKEYSYLPFR